jgi:RimJ/RimL family protein N-acetyltransferase
MPDNDLVLRRLRDGDCDALLTWVGSRDAMIQWAGPRDFSWPLTREQLLNDLEAADDRRTPFAAVREGDDGTALGHVMLTRLPDHGTGVIGRVTIAPAQRGRGLGTALMREVVRIGFDEHGLHRLQLAVYDFNRPAIACYESAGFVIEGTHRDSTRGSDGYWSSHTMALLEPSYRAIREADADRGPVRRARMTDAAAVSELLTGLGYPHGRDDAEARLRVWAGDAQGVVLVAERDGRVVGFVAVHALPYFQRSGYFARVTALAVDPERRRGGIGRQLLDGAEEWAVSHGCHEIEITSSRRRTDAHAFYRHLGYEDLCDRAAWFKREIARP